MSEMNAAQKAIQALYDSLPEQMKAGFDLEAALSAKATKAAASPPSRKVKEPKAAIAREAQAVIEHLMQKTPLALVKCQECNREYATTYKHVKFCGDICRAEWMRREWGFVWDPEKSEEERWGFEYELPKVISPETLEKLQGWARRILDLGKKWDTHTVTLVSSTEAHKADKEFAERIFPKIDAEMVRLKADLARDLAALAPPRKNRFSSY